DYGGTIQTYGNRLADQLIVNVQLALQEQGYYAGGPTGSLGPATRQAIANYQQDAGLIVTGAIDAPTVESLGLNGKRMEEKGEVRNQAADRGGSFLAPRRELFRPAFGRLGQRRGGGRGG